MFTIFVCSSLYYCHKSEISYKTLFHDYQNRLLDKYKNAPIPRLDDSITVSNKTYRVIDVIWNLNESFVLIVHHNNPYF